MGRGDKRKKEHIYRLATYYMSAARPNIDWLLAHHMNDVGACELYPSLYNVNIDIMQQCHATTTAPTLYCTQCTYTSLLGCARYMFFLSFTWICGGVFFLFLDVFRVFGSGVFLHGVFLVYLFFS